MSTDVTQVKSLADSAAAIGAAVSAVFAFIIMVLRYKDKRSADSVLGELKEMLGTLSSNVETCMEQYTKYVPIDQAELLIDNTLDLAEAYLRCWLCKYIRAKQPQMTSGKWNLDLVIHAQHIAACDRVRDFIYKDNSVADSLTQESFDKLCEELKQNLSTFSGADASSAAGKYLGDCMSDIRKEAKERL